MTMMMTNQWKAYLPVLRKKRAVDVAEVQHKLKPRQEGALQRNSVFKNLENVDLYAPVTGPIKHEQSCADVLIAAIPLVQGQKLAIRKAWVESA